MVFGCLAGPSPRRYPAGSLQWGDGQDQAGSRCSMKSYREDKALQAFPYVLSKGPVIQRSRDPLKENSSSGRLDICLNREARP